MKKAFTLAEVLITLGIIGVVAAMTMPTLIQNHQKRSLEVATQKFYSMMSQAVRQYMADEDVDDLRNTWLASDNQDDWRSPQAKASIENFITRYLKVVKECTDNADECFAEKYKTWDNQEVSMNNFYNSYVLSDGSVVLAEHVGTYGPIALYVDVNGKKGPNKIGYDLWNMDIFYDGSIDETTINPECKKGVVSPESGMLCGGYGNNPKEVRKNKFDYCHDDGTNFGGAYGGCFGHFMENGFKFDY